jgi:hypothetical protein
MILEKQINPRATMSVGMLSLIAALWLRRLVRPIPSFGPDQIDAVQGCLFGLSIGLNLLWVRMNRDRGRKREG